MFPSRWKLCTYALIVLLGCAIAAPNLLTAGQRPHCRESGPPRKQVTLGLDLRWADRISWSKSIPAVLQRDQLDALAERARSTLREARIAATVGTLVLAVTVRISEDARRAEAERQLRGLTATVSLSAFTEPQRDLSVHVPGKAGRHNRATSDRSRDDRAPQRRG